MRWRRSIWREPRVLWSGKVQLTLPEPKKNATFVEGRVLLVYGYPDGTFKRKGRAYSRQTYEPRFVVEVKEEDAVGEPRWVNASPELHLRAIENFALGTIDEGALVSHSEATAEDNYVFFLQRRDDALRYRANISRRLEGGWVTDEVRTRFESRVSAFDFGDRFVTDSVPSVHPAGEAFQAQVLEPIRQISDEVLELERAAQLSQATPVEEEPKAPEPDPEPTPPPQTNVWDRLE